MASIKKSPKKGTYNQLEFWIVAGVVYQQLTLCMMQRTKATSVLFVVA